MAVTPVIGSRTHAPYPPGGPLETFDELTVLLR